jgi:hypothetical protein
MAVPAHDTRDMNLQSNLALKWCVHIPYPNSCVCLCLCICTYVRAQLGLEIASMHSQVSLALSISLQFFRRSKRVNVNGGRG